MADWSCACGYDANVVRPRYGVEWQRAHAVAHKAAFPDLDEVSVRNLDWFVELAEMLERDKAKGCPECGRRYSHKTNVCVWNAPEP